MVELKTLKNMSFRDDGSLTEKDPTKMYLKDEAIKWIKYLDENPNNCDNGDCYCQSCSSILWIKHFFDITDEDLK